MSKLINPKLINKYLKHSKRTVNTIQNLANETVQKLGTSAAQDFIENPIGFIREGSVRERIARKALQSQGIKVPTRTQVAKSVAKTPEAQELIVNTSGFYLLLLVG